MGKTRSSQPLIFRPHVIPDIYGHDGCFVVFMDDQRQTVSQNEFFIRNFNTPQ